MFKSYENLDVCFYDMHEQCGSVILQFNQIFDIFLEI